MSDWKQLVESPNERLLLLTENQWITQKITWSEDKILVHPIDDERTQSRVLSAIINWNSED